MGKRWVWTLLTLGLAVAAGGCSQVEEPWEGADAEAKKKWQTARSDVELHELRDRVALTQDDR